MSGNKPTIVIIAIISFAFGLMMIGNVLPPFIDATMSEDFTENFSANIGAGETSVVCGLTYEHYYGDTSHMDVESNDTSDDPFIMAYNDATYDVTIDGLVDAGTRILSIDYVRERDNSTFTYFNGFMTAVPFLIGAGLIFMLVKSFF